MTTPQNRRRSAAAQPAPEALEGRVLLSRTIKGTDLDGDTWTLSLVGPGDFQVTNQNAVPLKQPGLIKDITIVGGNTNQTRLVGTVKKGPNGDRKVFFQNMIALNNPQVPEVNGLIRTNLNGRGLLAVDMPRFYLGDTSGGTFTPTAGQPVGQIDLPNGTTSLRFGGIDTTAFFGTDATRRLDQNNRSDAFEVNLALPQYLGTSIITDTIVTANQPAVGTGQPTQDTATFNVQGRLNIFQANTIDGDPTEPTERYQGPNTGGTTVLVTADDLGTTGQIGYLQINGNATNLTVAVSSTTPSGSPTSSDFSLISNFYIGGETNKVSVSAPGGMRNVLFGRGMDTVAINTKAIYHLVANRGAVASTVVSQGPITLSTFGGDVVNSRVLSGYFLGGTAANPTFEVGAGGKMTTRIAGNVTNSVFAASAVPLTPDGDVAIEDANTILYQNGKIDAKYEGKIDNSTVLPIAPNQAFFAKTLSVSNGPVVPPNVNEPPARASINHRGQIGLMFRGGPLGTFREANLNSPVLNGTEAAATIKAKAVTPKAASPAAVKVNTVVPKGPALASTSKVGNAV